MKLSFIIKGALAFFLFTPLARSDILKFMDECTTHCKKSHTRMGNVNDVENAATAARHTSEDIVVASCLQRCRLAEIIRPKSTIEMGSI